MLNILEAYAQPDKSFDDLRQKYTRRFSFPISSETSVGLAKMSCAL